MSDLTTKYMGLELNNPIVAGASNLTAHIDTIRKMEDAGAGAIVIKSLFEEQIQLEAARLDAEMNQYNDMNAEMTSVFPDIEHSGPEEHLLGVQKIKEACGIPVIASLNAVQKDTWTEWAKKLAETGVDGLELNFFANPEIQTADGASIEKDQLAVVNEVVSAVDIPVSVKMSVFYTAPLAVAREFAGAGARGLVLFNQFFQPDINPEREESTIQMNLSEPNAHRLPLRYSGLLFGETEASIIASSGIMDAMDVVRMLLAGADAVQVVSTLYRNKISRITAMVDDLSKWMESKGYKTLADFQGKLSRKNNPDRWAYKRAQYAELLMKKDPMAING